MSIAEIQSLDRNITNKKISMPYPHIKVTDVSDVLALVIPSLDKGDLPIICEFEGVTRQVGSIRKSAVVIKHLMDISGVVYCKSEDLQVPIKSMESLLEVL